MLGELDVGVGPGISLSVHSQLPYCGCNGISCLWLPAFPNFKDRIPGNCGQKSALSSLGFFLSASRSQQQEKRLLPQEMCLCNRGSARSPSEMAMSV